MALKFKTLKWGIIEGMSLMVRSPSAHAAKNHCRTRLERFHGVGPELLLLCLEHNEKEYDE